MDAVQELDSNVEFSLHIGESHGNMLRDFNPAPGLDVSKYREGYLKGLDRAGKLGSRSLKLAEALRGKASKNE